MKIILVGGPASGKTTIGKLIASTWNLAFLDTDHWIETEWGKSISHIFAEEGEPVFRASETQALQTLLQQENCVISTGGGVVKKAENRHLLTSSGAKIIYLDVGLEQQLKRTEKDQSRPLLMGGDKAAILKKLHQERDPLYRNVASFIVDANVSTSAILRQIKDSL